MFSLALLAHPVHDGLVVRVFALIACSVRRVPELVQRKSVIFALRGEKREVVLVVTNDVLQIRCTGPSRSNPVLEGLESAFDSCLEGAFHIFLDVGGCILVHVVEGQLGKFATDDDLAQVGDLIHHIFELCRSVIHQVVRSLNLFKRLQFFLILICFLFFFLLFELLRSLSLLVVLLVNLSLSESVHLVVVLVELELGVKVRVEVGIDI